jgi:hypothetical protein
VERRMVALLQDLLDSLGSAPVFVIGALLC